MQTTNNRFNNLVFYAGVAVFITSAAYASVPERPSGCDLPSGTSNFYSKCTQSVAPNSGTNPTPYCLDDAGDTAYTNLLSTAANITVQRQGHSDGTTNVIVDIPVINCRAKTNKVVGDFALVVDSSDSICGDAATNQGTDCSSKRITLAKNIMDEIFTSGADAPNAPTVGIVSYGGRYGNSLPAMSDTLNYNFTKTACEDTDSNSPTTLQTTPWTGADRSTATMPEPWRTQSGSSYYSYCEFLRLSNFSAAVKSKFESFLDFTSTFPRGATDLTYFLEAAGRTTMLGGSLKSAKNAIIITDGLPNIPKKRPKAECDARWILKQQEYSKTDAGVEFCYDRQFLAAKNAANNYAEGLSPFLPGGADRFPNTSINVYNTLFVSDGLAYTDVDADSTLNQPINEGGIYLNPFEFLAENSARTGNGKQKIKYLRGSTLDTKQTEYLGDMLEWFDAAAVHHVEVTVGTKKAYNVVSNASFTEHFHIRLAGLDTGSNAVSIKIYYNDSGATPKTVALNVTVQDAAYANTATTFCADAPSNRTVDGDLPTDTNPAGDGVLPFANTNTSTTVAPLCRVFRNNDDDNNANDFNTVRSDINADVSLRARASKLRLQGGMGNCGTIITTRTANSPFVYLFLMLLPLVGIFFIQRKNR